jgi:DNA-binding IclR family transcriptional regulator
VSKRLPRATIAGVLTAVAVTSVPLASSAAEAKVEQLLFRSITERYRLEAELQKIRERGYAITHGQRTQGAVGLAAPVFQQQWRNSSATSA